MIKTFDNCIISRTDVWAISWHLFVVVLILYFKNLIEKQVIRYEEECWRMSQNIISEFDFIKSKRRLFLWWTKRTWIQSALLYRFKLIYELFGLLTLDFCPNQPGRNQMYQKFDSLQYNTLVCWEDGTSDSSTKHLTFQVWFFFIISYGRRELKTLYFHFCNFIKK